jgi:hypothetical protein
MAATLILRGHLFRRHARAKGLTTEAAIAAAMHVDRSTVHRVLAGTQAPGNAFVAGALLAFPELDARDLFTATTSAQGTHRVHSANPHDRG